MACSTRASIAQYPISLWSERGVYLWDPVKIWCKAQTSVSICQARYSSSPSKTAGADEVEAIVVEIESAQGRRDNIRVRFNDGRFASAP